MISDDDPLEQLQRTIQQVDVVDLIRTFDAEFDLPFRHHEALGLLEMKRAFAPAATDAGGPALALRVGAFWCRIVSDDVRFDLAHALAAIERSRTDALRLRDYPGEFEGYVAARWADGAGKVLYRTGSHARGRILFEDACGIAEDRALWWCLPDLRSNYLRAQMEEARQAGERRGKPMAAAVTALEAEIARQEGVARTKRVPLTGVLRPAPHQHREFARGYFSLLHNLSIARHQNGDVAGSVALAVRVQALATSSKDEYRQAQALLQQIQPLMPRVMKRELDVVAQAHELAIELEKLRWERGKLIARQQLAVIKGGAAGIQDLLDQVRSTSDESGTLTGLDVESKVYAADRALALIDGLPTTEQEHWRKEIRRAQETVARSVRQVIALPAYKRSYSRAIRPVYLAGVQEFIAETPEGMSEGERWEGALTLVEESTGRELLDLMASTALPTLERPPQPSSRPDALTSAQHVNPWVLPDPSVGSDGSDSRRRSRPRRTGPDERERVGDTLRDREREFESQFLRNPLQAAAHDPEIARKAEGYVINNPGTCIVRYFGFAAEKDRSSRPARLGAFVIRDGLNSPVQCGDYQKVRELVDNMIRLKHPTAEHARDIWELLLAPIWDAIAPHGREPAHLLIVPSDELFAVPFHIATPTGGIPLGARLPLSHSVSLSAYLLRSRHQLRRQRVEPADDLAAMVLRDGGMVSGDEVAVAMWDQAHLHVAGDVPPGLVSDVGAVPRATWEGLKEITATRPEFFLYAGHGGFLPEYGELGPFLQIEDSFGRRDIDVLTPFDVALRVRLPRNRLTILGACVAGQGAQTASGDVAGFLRALIAAGAGAIALPLWSVLDHAMVTSAGHLLRASRAAITPRSSPQAPNGDGVYDVVATLHTHYKQIVAQTAEKDWIDALPLALYT
ncbi:MAG: CHAT domain-containing protein [Pseudonocardia sp.]